MVSKKLQFNCKVITENLADKERFFHNFSLTFDVGFLSSTAMLEQRFETCITPEHSVKPFE